MITWLPGRIVPAVIACFYSAVAIGATGGEWPVFSINGYGTLGVLHSSEDDGDYIADIFRPNGAGHTRSWSADIDSRIGLQITAEITPRLSAIWQVTSEQRYDNSYSPSTEWLNIKYQFTPDFSVRVGRFVQPTFLFGKSRKVAYTYPWVRPPTEVYGLVPVFHNDGIDIAYRMQLGQVVQSLEAAAGSRDIKLPERLGGNDQKAEDTFSAMSTTEYGAVTLRLSYHQTRLTTVDFLLFDTLREFGPEGIAIADRYDIDGDRLQFVGIGVNYDPGQWFAVGEIGTVDYHNGLGKSTGGYLSGGYRFGTLTPYMTYARRNFEDVVSDPGLTLSSLPPSLVDLGAALNTGLNSFLGIVAVGQETIAVGLRWDLMSNVAIKMQYDFVQHDDHSSGQFGNLQPDFAPGGDAQLFSASVDFVF